MQELRCPKCGRLLGKAELKPGCKIEIACRTKSCKDNTGNIIRFGVPDEQIKQ